MSEPRGKNAENRVTRRYQELKTDYMASVTSGSSLFGPLPGVFNLYGDSSPKTGLAYIDDDNNDLCGFFSAMSIYNHEPSLPDSLEQEPTTSYKSLFFNAVPSAWAPSDYAFAPSFDSDSYSYSPLAHNRFKNHGTENLPYEPFHLLDQSFSTFYPRSDAGEFGDARCTLSFPQARGVPFSYDSDILRGNRGNSHNVGGGSDDDVAAVLSMVARDGAFALAKDQNGSRFLQAVIADGNSAAVRIVLEGIIENVVDVMVNPFGNHVLQKLIPLCERHQRLRIILMLTKQPGRFIRVSMDVYGTRVVQKLIENADTRQQFSLLSSSIQSCFLDLIKDTAGSHVIQRCLQCFSCADNQFIFDAAARFCVDVATHQHGCCVLKNCLTYSIGEYQDKMVSEICKHGLLLAQDPYGNYVVQHVIELDIPRATGKLLSQFRGKFADLSMQKFSSHVVEIFLKLVQKSRSMIVSELLSFHQFELLLQDPYANYVVQRALEVTKGPLHSSLVEAISRHEDLRTSIFCKKIFSANFLKK